jgi:hypothetical protein
MCLGPAELFFFHFESRGIEFSRTEFPRNCMFSNGVSAEIHVSQKTFRVRGALAMSTPARSPCEISLARSPFRGPSCELARSPLRCPPRQLPTNCKACVKAATNEMHGLRDTEQKEQPRRFRTSSEANSRRLPTKCMACGALSKVTARRFRTSSEANSMQLPTRFGTMRRGVCLPYIVRARTSGRPYVGMRH